MTNAASISSDLKTSRTAGEPVRRGGAAMAMALVGAIAGIALVVLGIWLFRESPVLATEHAPREADMERFGWAVRSLAVAAIALAQLLFALLVLPAAFRRGMIDQALAVTAGVTLTLAVVAAAALGASAI